MYDHSTMGKKCYKSLPMGVANYTNIFQQKMNDLFHQLNFIRAKNIWPFDLDYEYCTDHVQKLELTLNKLKEKWLKNNIERSFFRQTEMEYSDFWVTRDEIKPTSINIGAITNTNIPNHQIKKGSL